MYVFCSFNKLYFNYDREKFRKRQYNIVLRYCDNHDNYIKCPSNNKPDNKNREKDCNKHCSECCLEYCSEHCFKYCECK